jgi:hypothetical protein
MYMYMALRKHGRMHSNTTAAVETIDDRSRASTTRRARVRARAAVDSRALRRIH